MQYSFINNLMKVNMLTHLKVMYTTNLFLPFYRSPEKVKRAPHLVIILHLKFKQELEAVVSNARWDFK